ncbi:MULTISPECIES: ABC transporter ATP-binding protein [Rhizobium]|uniref:ABC transporter ATP-binding protein n=1 Tax=Rhizobium tropici TaxID=398 RepID=A0A329YA31_RHITR|nr:MULTISPECIES: ABC transporter ATP-binding protein [Rhizobium]MBB3287125.1 putative ABC transport system ATP-binding protein [Rhizobium sp. BK252]MBB3401865.1 putative ABC transport system ATP-binding protein [Rhizobium sp. BK289]MBB3414191.1 putative ABC transport system ATP-binding protein [Rhizobium sp. BK284]MBB3482078.1 putative ABC transport system ATP-binding protein [Rhizobium sp. BK347]RAX37330.1 ABC transporter ATP-binding protein [Rhizobium tropici]
MTASTSNEPYIVLNNVKKGYRIGTETIPIFADLNLEIAQGEFVAIMGPSGSGKSTLLNMLSGIDRPDQGRLRIGVSNLDQMGEAARSSWRAHNMGIVFQFYNLLPMLNAAENIELPLLLKPLSSRERRVRVDKVLDLVGLSGRQKQYPKLMSGGQQQRVGIARAIVADPALLLCDEPTGDLDRRSADEVLEMLRFLNRELGKTIIMVTHDPQAASYAGRTLHLDKGRFVEERRADA